MHQFYFFQKPSLKKVITLILVKSIKTEWLLWAFHIAWQLYSFSWSFHFPRPIHSFIILILSSWPCFLNDLAKGSKQNRTSKIFTPTSAHRLCLAHVNLLPISLSRPLLWVSIPSSPPTQRHCSCKLLFSPEFSLSSSAMDLFQHHENMLL